MPLARAAGADGAAAIDHDAAGAVIGGFGALVAHAGQYGMSNQNNATVIGSSGLRYRSKTSGSPFADSKNTRSCFKCGRHRPPDQLRSMKVLGRSEMVCKPTCSTLP